MGDRHLSVDDRLPMQDDGFGIEVRATRRKYLKQVFMAEDIYEALDIASTLGTWFDGVDEVTLWDSNEEIRYQFTKQTDALDLYLKVIGKVPMDPLDNPID